MLFILMSYFITLILSSSNTQFEESKPDTKDGSQHIDISHNDHEIHIDLDSRSCEYVFEGLKDDTLDKNKGTILYCLHYFEKKISVKKALFNFIFVLPFIVSLLLTIYISTVLILGPLDFIFFLMIFYCISLFIIFLIYVIVKSIAYRYCSKKIFKIFFYN